MGTSRLWGATSTALLMTLAGCSQGDDGPAERAHHDPTATRGGTPSGDALGDVPPPIRALADEHVRSVLGTTVAPHWSEAARVIGPAVPMYRPDVDGPAYFELAVNEGGYVVVATGDHDVPIPQFADRGERPSTVLARDASARGRAIARTYRLDTLTYAAEDEGEELVAELGASVLAGTEPLRGEGGLLVEGVPRFSTFRALKRDYGTAFAPHLVRLRAAAAAAWTTQGEPSATVTPSLTPRSDDYKNANPNLAMTEARWVYRADLLRDAIRFSQENVNGCLSGCGPVAWAQVTAYMGFLAGQGDSFYGYLGAGRLYTGQTTAFPFDEPTRALVWSLHDGLNARCFGEAAATTPPGMNLFDDWAQERGASRLKLDVAWMWGQGGHAEKWLRLGRPVVVGTGALQHYAVAVAFGTVRRGGETDKYIYVNQGWGGHGNGWIPLSVYYSATVTPG